MPKRAIITGVTGQDGSYLAELLLSEGNGHEPFEEGLRETIAWYESSTR